MGNPSNIKSLLYPSRSLAVANFLASFGGGMILGKSMGLLSHTSYLKGDSLLAYLLGVTLGLFIMKVGGKGKLLKHFTRYSGLSVVASISMLVLLFCRYDEIINGSYLSFIFFSLLIFRFSFWFLARIVRVDISAGVGQNLAWTESSYSFGMILGLVVWQSSWTNFTILQLLCVDILAQTIVSFLDNYSFRLLKNFIQSSEASVVKKGKIPLKIYLGIAGFIICLSNATQIVEFGFATFSIDFFKNGKSFGANIVAVAYAGAAIGALIIGKLTLEYDEDLKFLGVGRIKMSNFSISIISLCVLCFVILSLTFVTAFNLPQYGQGLSLLMIFVSTLLFELIVLVLLNNLGKIAKKVGDVGSIADIYAYMGAFGSLCMVVFVQLLRSKYDFILASGIFFLLGYLFLTFAHKKENHS